MYNRVIYIDKAHSIDDIRIGEKKIFHEHFINKGINVDFLLMSNNIKRKSDTQKNITYRFNSSLNSYFSIDFFIVFIELLLMLRSHKYDYIISRKNAGLGLAAIIISKIFKVNHIYILSFPKWESLKDRSNFRIFNLILEIFSFIYKKIIVYVIKESYLILPQTKQFWEHFSKENNIENKSYYPIPMCMDIVGDNPKEKKNYLKVRYGFDLNKKIVIYFGSIDKDRKVEFILDVFFNVLRNNSEILFLLIGGGKNQATYIQNLIDNSKFSSNFIVLPYLSREILFEYIIASDLSISALPPIPTFIISSPTKVVESMGLGTPVIANSEILDHVELISNSQGGILEEYNSNLFSRRIVEIIDNGDDLNQMSNNSFEYVRKFRSYRILSQKLIEILYEGCNDIKE